MIAGSLQPEAVHATCQPRSRFAYGLTSRAIGLLAAGLLLALPGFFVSAWGYGMLAWDGVVLLAALLDGLRLPEPQKIKVERSWSNAPSLGSETEIELAVRQSSEIALDCILIDDLPDALLAKPATYSLHCISRVRSAMQCKITPRERGDVRAGALFVRYRSGLGLVERWAKASLEQEVRIYPARRQGEEQQIFLARGSQIDVKLRQLRQRGLGRDFESLREYRPGDDLRDVCWTATARRGQLITRQYQTERSQAIWIVLDAGRLLRRRILAQGASPDELGHSKLDYACSTAVALAQLALFSGDRVGLMVYGQRVQQQVLPGRGAAHLRQIIEALAQATAEESEADHFRATAVLTRLQPNRAMILWVTDLAESASRPEVVEGAMQLLRRHVLLFVAMGQLDVERLAQACPQNVDEMFRGAAAQEPVGRRELQLAELRQMGALTLDLDPSKVTAAVLNQYLLVKERAMV